MQYWAWERMPYIDPHIIQGDTYHYQESYATRWNYTLSHTNTPAHVLVTYRSTFTALRPEQFMWTPYGGIIHLLPHDCREGHAIWAYCGWLVFWSTVEPHTSNRVARQFGYVQDIPTTHLLLTPHQHSELHATKRIGSRNTNWVVKHQAYIDNWNDRHNDVFVGHAGVTTTPDYMQWYYDRTVLCITNPGLPTPANRYPEWGGTQQLYHEGMREIYHRAQQTIDSQPDSSQVLHDFVQIPRQMMQFGHTEERMSYGSQHFQFPTPAYHPAPPSPQTGAYYQPTPGGANNQDGFENNMFNNFFNTPSSPYNLFDIPSNTLLPDYHMDPRNQQIEMGGRRSAFSPIPMGSLSNLGTSQNPSSSRNLDMNEPYTSLAVDQEDVAPQQHQQGRRHRRQNTRPHCGTGGHL